VAITTKSGGHVEVDNIQDDLPYYLNEKPNVLPVTGIEEVEGLTCTLIVELVNDETIRDKNDL